MASRPPEPWEDQMEELKKQTSLLMRHLRIVSPQNMTSPAAMIPLKITGFKTSEPNYQESEPFYTGPCGYKLCLRAELTAVEKSKALNFIVHACLMQGEFDCELDWPVKARVTIQIQNQAGDSDHVQRSKQVSWQHKSLGDPLPIPVMTDVDVVKDLLDTAAATGSKYVGKDGTLQLTVKYMAL